MVNKIREFIKDVEMYGNVFCSNSPLTFSVVDDIIRRFRLQGSPNDKECIIYCSPKLKGEISSLLKSINKSDNCGTFKKSECLALDFLCDVGFWRGGYIFHIIEKNISGSLWMPIKEEVKPNHCVITKKN